MTAQLIEAFWKALPPIGCKASRSSEEPHLVANLDFHCSIYAIEAPSGKQAKRVVKVVKAKRERISNIINLAEFL